MPTDRVGHDDRPASRVFVRQIAAQRRMLVLPSPYFVATLACYVLVDAETEEEARALALPALQERYAEVLSRHNCSSRDSASDRGRDQVGGLVPGKPEQPACQRRSNIDLAESLAAIPVKESVVLSGAEEYAEPHANRN